MPIVACSLLATLASLAAAAVLWLSNTTLFLAGGSDALIEVIEPNLAGQVVMFLVTCALLALAVALARRRRRRAVVVLPLVAALVALALASHRVLIDGARGNIRDVWVLVTLQRIQFALADGPAGSADLATGRFGDWITPHQGQPVFLLMGPPPVALDLSNLRHWWK